MEQNKLKLEDCSLTYEQVKELQELGIDMSKSCLLLDCYGFPVIRDRIERTLKQAKKMGFKVDEYIPTLTNTEMLEMLPINITLKGDILSFMIGRDVSNNYYNVVYQCIYADSCCISFNNKLLRDSLFEMIRYLKTNKLM